MRTTFFLLMYCAQIVFGDSGAYIMVREINYTNCEIGVFRIGMLGDCEGLQAKGPTTHDVEVAKLLSKRSGSPVFNLLAYFKSSVSESDAKVAFTEAQAIAAKVDWTEDLSTIFDSESHEIYNRPVTRATLVQWNDSGLIMTSLGKPTEPILRLVAILKLKTQPSQPGCWVSVQPLQVFRTQNAAEIDVLKKAGWLLPLDMENGLHTAMPSGSISLQKSRKMSDRVPVATLEVYKLGTNGMIMGSFY